MDEPKLRVAVIGAGAGVFDMHIEALRLPLIEVVGLCEVRSETARKASEAFGCPVHVDYRQMLAEARPDLVAILTPHPLHAQMTIDSLRAGCHVLVEKPVAVHIAQADEMVRVAEETGRVLAVNFQQRLRPEIIAAKDLIAEGRMGRLQHVDVKITWTRPAVYYTSSAWRGTWVGEGGAVLMNQAVHEFDLICHLFGLPARVFAWTRTIAHQIEAEDTVQAMLEWADGMLGSVHISTAEAGQPQRFEIMGSGGYLALGHGRLDFRQFDTELLSFLATSDKPFSEPKLLPVSIDLPQDKGDHTAVYRDLYEAIRTGRPPIAPASSGKDALELANAMNYSSRTGQVVPFPLDRARYAELLAQLQAASGAKAARS